MNKSLLLKAVISALFFCFSGVQLHAQKLSTTNKKALKIWSKAIPYFQERDYQNCIIELDKALEQDSNFLEVYYLKADIYATQKQPEQVIRALNAAIRLEQQPSSTSYFMRAKAHQQLGKYNKAIADYALFKSIVTPPEQKADADYNIQCCVLADSLTQNPVPFNPINLGSAINSPQNEYWPSLTIDEQELIFTRRLEQGSQMHEDFYLAHRDSTGWQTAQNMGAPMNTPANEGAQAISANGKTLVYTACNRPGGYGSCDLYISQKINGQWQTPQNMGPDINSRAWESQPTLSADGRTIYFVSNRPGTIGQMDIWQSTRGTDNYWSTPSNLGPQINTPKNETAPYIHSDGISLYFASNGLVGMGESDIYLTRKTAQGWTKPQNMGYPINTSGEEGGLITNTQGQLAYIASAREGGYGGLDLYQFTLPADKRPHAVTYVQGIVTDIETHVNLQAKVELINLATQASQIIFSDPTDGDFLLMLPANQSYALNVWRKGYLFYSNHFDLVGQHDQFNPFQLRIELQPIKADQKIVLKNVFFDTDKFTLKPESNAELLKLVAFLTANPSLKIEIGGHTDNQGNSKHNLILSQNRANSVENFLIEKGVPAARVSHQGYGQDQPIAPNTTSEGRALNRRTEVKIMP